MVGPDLPSVFERTAQAGRRAVVVAPIGFWPRRGDAYDLDIEARPWPSSAGFAFGALRRSTPIRDWFLRWRRGQRALGRAERVFEGLGPAFFVRKSAGACRKGSFRGAERIFEGHAPSNVVGRPPAARLVRGGLCVGAASGAGPVAAAAVGVGCPCLAGRSTRAPSEVVFFLEFGGAADVPGDGETRARSSFLPTATPSDASSDRCKHDVNVFDADRPHPLWRVGLPWTPLAGRIASRSTPRSSSHGLLDGEDAIYIWARTRRIVYGPISRSFGRDKVVDWAARSPAGYLASMFGSQIVQGQLSNGFTVVHTDEGDQFQLGILQPPARPKRPIQTSHGDRYVFVNEATDVRYDQVDFLGPFEVADTDQALFMRMVVNGPPVDVFVIHRATVTSGGTGSRRD